MKSVTFVALLLSVPAMSQIYDNGGLVTHPGQGAFGRDASAVQTSLGLSTFGFLMRLDTANPAASSRVADDFDVPAGGWTIGQAAFYTYQPDWTSTTSSPFIDMRVRIWDGPPDSGGTVVWGDLTTNRLQNSTFHNTYRVSDTTLGASDRPIFKNTCNIGVTLAPGRYWIEWTTAGSAALGGPFQPPVTILGQLGKPGANALQWTGGTSGSWSPAIDDGDPPGLNARQDFPFTLFAGGTQTLTVTSLTISQGLIVSGTAANLNASDDVYLVLRPGIIFSTSQDPIVIAASYTAPLSTATSLVVRFESRAQQNNTRQTIEAFNFVTNAYVPMDQRVLPTSSPDTVLNLNVSPTSVFIGPGREIRVRASYRTVGPIASYPWQVFIDEATIGYTP